MTKTDWKKWGKLVYKMFVPPIEYKFVIILRTECIVALALAFVFFLCGLFYYVLKGLPIENYMQVLDWYSDLPRDSRLNFLKTLIKTFVIMGFGAALCYIYALCWHYARRSQSQKQKVKPWEADPKPVMDDDIVGPSKTVFNTSATTPNVQPPVMKKTTVAKHYTNNEYSKETKKYH